MTHVELQTEISKTDRGGMCNGIQKLLKKNRRGCHWDDDVGMSGVSNVDSRASGKECESLAFVLVIKKVLVLQTCQTLPC